MANEGRLGLQKGGEIIKSERHERGAWRPMSKRCGSKNEEESPYKSGLRSGQQREKKLLFSVKKRVKKLGIGRQAANARGQL